MEIKEKEIIELYNKCKELISNSNWKEEIDLNQIKRDLGYYGYYTSQDIKLVDTIKEFPILNIYNKNDKTCGSYCKSKNQIKFNLLYVRDLENAKNTLLHELTHYLVENCWSFKLSSYDNPSINHKKSWQNLANYIGYIGNTSITTYATATNNEIMVMYKYVAKCNVCGKLIGRSRKGILTEHPEMCHCPNCKKGTFELIKG